MAKFTRHCFPQISKYHVLNATALQVMQEIVVNIRSNRVAGSRIPTIYRIFDDNMDLFDVVCDFDLNATNAWTLVQWYNLQQKISFWRLSFIVDHSVNALSPRWDAYRLSKFRMQSIQDDSSQFRMTCNYDTDGVVYRDYLQIAKDQLNILTSTTSGSCILVERINIRGHSCENCTTILI